MFPRSSTTYVGLRAVSHVSLSISTFNQNCLFVVGELRISNPIIVFIIATNFVVVARLRVCFGVHILNIAGLCLRICTISCIPPWVIPQDSMKVFIVPSRVRVCDLYISFIKVQNGPLNTDNLRRVSRDVIWNFTKVCVRYCTIRSVSHSCTTSNKQDPLMIDINSRSVNGCLGTNNAPRILFKFLTTVDNGISPPIIEQNWLFLNRPTSCCLVMA